MSVNIGFFPGPLYDVFCHGLPNKPRENDAAGCPDLRVVQGVNMVKIQFVKGFRNEWFERVGGNCAKEGVS